MTSSPPVLSFCASLFVWNPGCLALPARGGLGKRLLNENSQLGNFRTRRNPLPQWISDPLNRRKWVRSVKENFQKKIYLAVGRYDQYNPDKINRFHFCWLTSFLKCLQIVSCKLSDECYSAVEGYVTIICHSFLLFCLDLYRVFS